VRRAYTRNCFLVHRYLYLKLIMFLVLLDKLKISFLYRYDGSCLLIILLSSNRALRFVQDLSGMFKILIVTSLIWSKTAPAARPDRLIEKLCH